jgi:hypothetical protein
MKKRRDPIQKKLMSATLSDDHLERLTDEQLMDYLSETAEGLETGRLSVTAARLRNRRIGAITRKCGQRRG